jgi:hypothetical protein
VVAAVPFPNNAIPSSRLHPTSVKLLEFYPTPTVAGAGLRNNLARRRWAGPIDRDQLTVRGDYNESSKSTWFGRYSLG